MTIPRLSADEFADFFFAVHGLEPFPWQARLAKQVFSRGWPALLDIPTGAGKTAAIDIAVFHLALEADRFQERTAPVRICLVVDRRLVVDDAWNRARKIADRLAGSADNEVLKRAAARLALLAEQGAPPLAVARLRGGVPGDPDWIRTPAQPTVITSTVDQVGSRLLFRGYGVRDTMLPVHAGLLGSDTLFLLDEAHLSQPFVQTLKSVRERRRAKVLVEMRDHAPFHIVTLSATQEETGDNFLKHDDHRHNRLGPRLEASKPAELLLVKAGPGGGDVIADVAAERAWALNQTGGGAAVVVAVISNRVARARRVYDRLCQRAEEAGLEAGSIALLTGRSRPLDRRRVLATLLPRMAANRLDAGEAKPLLVVATQTIEAGADLDFDAMVTEVAPLDSLRQRFGRLNRMGRPIQAAGVIVAEVGSVAASAKPDPIYGLASGHTWRFLLKRARREGQGKNARQVIDFGVVASGDWVPSGPELTPLLAPRENAPVLLEPFVEGWSTTSPRPAAEAEPSLFLHGTQGGPGEVSVVWRADLDPRQPDDWCDRATVCPPSSLETLSLPFTEVRRWLHRKGRAEIADVEGGEADAEGDDGGSVLGRVLRWAGADDDRTKVVWPSELRAGDVVLVPSEYGGCDEWGWDPSSKVPVDDLSEEANLEHRGRDILRLSPRLLARDFADQGLAGNELDARVDRFSSRLRELAEERKDTIVNAVREMDLPFRWKQWLSGPNPRPVTGPRAVPYALERITKGSSQGGEATTEGDAGLLSGQRVLLSVHLAGVAQLISQYSTALGLPAERAEDLCLAGRLHDLGKAHPQFKLWLYGGDELAAAMGESLAKSGRARLPKRAREIAKLPGGARHETASLALAEAHPDFKSAHDPDLVKWLIGTHHGRGRPFFPPVAWPQPGETFTVSVDGSHHGSSTVRDLATVTGEWLELRARLHSRYGPWHLAMLEAIVRLADHRQSERERSGRLEEERK